MIYGSLIVLSTAALLCFAAVNAQQGKCGPNEGRYPCGKRCEDRCNTPPRASCKGLQCEPPHGCRCKDGFARDPDSTNLSCVPKSQCPKTNCATGEFKGACGRRCEGTCESPRTPGICARIKCSDADCRCDMDAGFVRHKNGKCVRVEEC